MPFPTGLEQFYLFGVGIPGAPHARTSGKNLKGIRAEFVSLDGRSFERSSGEGVNTDAHFPGYRARSRAFRLPVGALRD